MATNADVLPRFGARSASNTDATSYAAASWTPTDGRVITAVVTNYRSAGSPDTPTASGTNGLNGTWTQFSTVTVGNVRMTAFWSVATSGVAGVLTFDFGGSTQSAAAWWIEEWSNTNTTTPVIAANTTTFTNQTLTSSSTITLPNALTAAFNKTVGHLSLQANLSISPGINFAMLNTHTAVTDGLCIGGQFGSELAVDFTHAATAVDKVGIAFELAHDGTGAGTTNLGTRVRSALVV